MKGFFGKTNPSQYVDKYVIGKKNKDRQATTESLKKMLFECALSPIDTDVYGSMLVIAELKLKRAYSSTFLSNLTKEYVKVVHNYAMINKDNYNRYAYFVTDYEDKLRAQVANFKKTGKSEPELMEDNYYARLVESMFIMKTLKDDLREVYYHYCPNERPKKDNNERVE